MAFVEERRTSASHSKHRRTRKIPTRLVRRRKESLFNREPQSDAEERIFHGDRSQEDRQDKQISISSVESRQNVRTEIFVRLR